MKEIGSYPGAVIFRSYSSLIIVLIAITVFLAFIDGLEKDIERAGLQKAVNEINASLAVSLYTYVVKGKLNELQQSHLTNPFDFLSANDALLFNYFGTVRHKSEMIREGGWYFDSESHEVIYRSAYGLGEFSYILEFKYQDRNRSGRFEIAEDELLYFRLSKKKPPE